MQRIFFKINLVVADFLIAYMNVYAWENKKTHPAKSNTKILIESNQKET